MRNAEALAKGGNHFRFGPAFRSKRVIHSRGLDLIWPRLAREKEQGEAVRPAGDGDANPGFRGDQDVEVAPETIGR